jgi:hypothetical protein
MSQTLNAMATISKTPKKESSRPVGTLRSFSRAGPFFLSLIIVMTSIKNSSIPMRLKWRNRHLERRGEIEPHEQQRATRLSD